jgi:hypothetical protein
VSDRLNDITFYDADLDAEFKRWREAIEKANRWSVAPPLALDESSGGRLLTVRGPTAPGRAVVGSGGVTASPGASAFGVGSGVLWIRGSGVNLVNRGTVKLFNPFKVAFVSGELLVVVPDREGYLIMGADCPTPGGGP